MDYLFRRQDGSWYPTGLTDSETKPESTAAAASEPAPMAESEVQDAILAAAGDSGAVSSEEAAPAESADSTPAESAPAADSTAAESTAASGEAASESTAA